VDATLLALLRCPLTGSGVELVCATEVDGDVRYGVLAGDAVEYPVVEGIPVMLEDLEPVVDLVRAGRHDDATARLLLEDIPPGGWRRIVDAFGSIRRTRAAASVLQRRDDARRSRAVAAALRDPAPGALMRFAFLESSGRMVDAYDYFSLRIGTPRHLIALSCIEAVPDGDDPVLDVGCGLGILTWALAARVAPRPTIGLDRSFLMLLAAQRDVLPDGRFVCGDATALPFADHAFGAALLTDVLTFVDRRRTVVSELERVLGPRGWCALTSLHNDECEYTFTRHPVSVDAWRRLVGHLPHRVMSDDTVLERYLDGRGLPSGPGGEVGDDDHPTRFTVVVARCASDLVDQGPWREWPHARGALHVNPLFEPRARSGGGVEYARHLPSDVYRIDNAPVAEYVPERAFVSDDVWSSLADGRPSDEARELVESMVLVGGPRFERRVTPRD
jgi:SAM-dependent methyltransferase/uncharacterized protein YbaR (Trm112 family)